LDPLPAFATSRSGLSAANFFAEVDVGIAMAQSRLGIVEAKPESIPIDLAQTAVLVIDMQNDWRDGRHVRSCRN
jgi:hypothetical protein